MGILPINERQLAGGNEIAMARKKKIQMTAPQAVQALSALAHATRLAVFRMLVQAGAEGMTPSVIAETLDLPAPPLSFHLKELSIAGLIAARPEGRNIHYSANFASMNALIVYLTENCCNGAPCELDVCAEVDCTT